MDDRSSARRNRVEHELLERAAALFAERGFRSTSLQEIAEALQVSRPALYHYISSKDELLGRLVAGVIDDMVSELEEVLSFEVTVPEQFELVIERLAARVSSQPARFRLLERANQDLPDAVAQEYREGRARAVELLTTMIRAGIRAGSVRPVHPQLAAAGILSSLLSLGTWQPRDGDIGAGDVSATLKAMFIDGLSERDDSGFPVGTNPVARSLGAVKAHLRSLEERLTEADVL